MHQRRHGGTVPHGLMRRDGDGSDANSQQPCSKPGDEPFDQVVILR